MSNGLKTATLMSVIVLVAGMLLVPTAFAASGNVGYGEGDGISVMYADSEDGKRGKLYISLSDVGDMGDTFTITIDSIESAPMHKNSIIGGVLKIATKPLSKDCTHTVSVSDGEGYDASVTFEVSEKMSAIRLDITHVKLTVGQSIILHASAVPDGSLHGVWFGNHPIPPLPLYRGARLQPRALALRP